MEGGGRRVEGGVGWGGEREDASKRTSDRESERERESEGARGRGARAGRTEGFCGHEGGRKMGLEQRMGSSEVEDGGSDGRRGRLGGAGAGRPADTTEAGLVWWVGGRGDLSPVPRFLCVLPSSNLQHAPPPAGSPPAGAGHAHSISSYPPGRPQRLPAGLISAGVNGGRQAGRPADIRAGTPALPGQTPAGRPAGRQNAIGTADGPLSRPDGPLSGMPSRPLRFAACESRRQAS